MQKEVMAPVVEIDKLHFDENYYTRDGYTWDCPTLIAYCKRQNYQVFDTPLAAINISGIPWKISSIKDLAYHVSRINTVDTTYPVIMDDEGYIADGWHRVVSALINGKTTIPAIRIQTMPQISGKSDTDATNSK